MNPVDLTNFLAVLVLVQFYFIRRLYMHTKVLRLEFSMFVKNTNTQISEITTSAQESITEQVRFRFSDKTEKECENFLPDDVRGALHDYWERVGGVQESLGRNGLKKLSLGDLRFGLSKEFK